MDMSVVEVQEGRKSDTCCTHVVQVNEGKDKGKALKVKVVNGM